MAEVAGAAARLVPGASERARLERGGENPQIAAAKQAGCAASSQPVRGSTRANLQSNDVLPFVALFSWSGAPPQLLYSEGSAHMNVRACSEKRGHRPTTKSVPRNATNTQYRKKDPTANA